MTNNKNLLKETRKTYFSKEAVNNFIMQEDLRTKGGILQDFINLATSKITNNELKVLDVGCGSGRDVSFMRSKGLNAYGVDFSPNMIENAQKMWGPYFEVMDIYDIGEKLENNSYSAIFCTAVFVHIPKDDALNIIKNIKNKLSIGGIFSFVTKEGDYQKINTRLGENFRRLMIGYSSIEIEVLFSQAGLDIVTIEQKAGDSYQNDNWLYVIAKKNK